MSNGYTRGDGQLRHGVRGAITACRKGRRSVASWCPARPYHGKHRGSLQLRMVSCTPLPQEAAWVAAAVDGDDTV